MIYDLRLDTPEVKEIMAETQRSTQLCFKINHTMPMTEEYNALVKELFKADVMVNAPIQCIMGDRVKFGKNVTIMYNCVMMSLGGITIDDDVMIAAKVSIITNNHDFKEKAIMPCAPVHIKKNAWIGAGATILPGYTTFLLLYCHEIFNSLLFSAQSVR